MNEEAGRLISCDTDGKIVKDAWKIIFPGANGDAWWTHDDLLNQVQFAIQIHKEINGPGIQALFIFDNSSAHATLPPDMLHAFDMNKSNGGKQRKQHDTIIPQSNPDPLKCGLPQKMTNDGKPKGLKSVLEEWGFNLTGLRSKCSPVVSQSVDLGQNNNPNTTPTKDYENVRVVVYLRSVQRGCAEEGERGSTPTG